MPRLKVTSDQLVIGLLFVVLAALACFSPAQGDTWWLLRAGQDIWQSGRVPLVDAYSHTAYGLYWPNHEWLTEAVFYGLHRLGGMPLLTLVCATTMTGAWLLSYRMTRGPFEARLLLLIASLTAAAGSFALRPQVFTMAFFVGVCWLLTTGRATWVPLVVLVWANFHGAVALGLVATVAAAGITLLSERRIPWKLSIVAALSIAATALTPMGTGLWRFWIESPQRSDANQLIEWQPPGLSPDLWPFWIVAAALPVLAVWKWWRLDTRTLQLAAIAIGVLPLAFQAIRNVHVFLIAALPALSSVIAAGNVKPARAPRGENERLNGTILLTVAGAAAIVVLLAWLRPPPALGWTPISSGAIAAVRACDDPVFNTYGDGGVLIWFVPEKRVFIDNRQDPFPPELLEANHDAELSGDYENLFATYGVRCAAVPTGSPIAEGLAADSDWAVRHQDDEWVVFTPAGSDGIADEPAGR